MTFKPIIPISLLFFTFLIFGCKTTQTDPVPQTVSPKIISGYLTVTSWNTSSIVSPNNATSWNFVTDSTWAANFAKQHTIDSSSTLNLYYVLQYTPGQKIESPLPFTLGDVVYSYFYNYGYYTDTNGKVVVSLSSISIEVKKLPSSFNNVIRIPGTVIFKYQIIPSNI